MKSKSINELNQESLTEGLLEERGKIHGDWQFNATVQCALKSCVDRHLSQRISRTEPYLPVTTAQHEALHMICVKIARIIAGDPKHKDHWDDIAGYARLGRDS
jgi:hypothetical protein